MTGVESANALDFTFSVTNINGNVSGTVEGLITGLNNNQANQVATSVEISSVPIGLNGIFEDGSNAAIWNTVFVNSFSVSNSVITSAEFEASSSGNDAFCLNGINNLSGFGCNNLSGLTRDAFATTVFNTNGFSGVTFAAVPFEFSPTLGLLLVGSLFGSNHFYRKYKANKVVLLTE